MTLDIENSVIDMVSVIVPVYNAEGVLARCIESVLRQTYQNFELLLIDDGSTDGSVGVCDDYALTDDRVKVFHKQNGGVSSARNAGLDKASGFWVMFLDADDWIEPDTLSICLQDRFAHNDMDLLMFSCVWAEDSRLPDRMCTKREDFQEILPVYLDKITFVVPYCKLFRREIIQTRHLRFDEALSSGEDTLFSFEYLLHVRTMRLVSAEMYHHTVGDNPDALSVKKGTDWERDHHYLLSRVCSVVDSLENTFGVSLMKFRCLLCESRVNKYLSYLRGQSWFFVKKGLEPLVKDGCLKYLWDDRKNMNKGERRHMFDFLAKAGATGLLALYVKYFRAEY